MQNGCQTDAVIDNPVGNLDELSHQEDKRKKRYINRKRSNKFFQDISIYDGGDLHLYCSLTLPCGGGLSLDMLSTRNAGKNMLTHDQ